MKDEELLDLYFSRNESAIQKTDEKYGAYCRKIAGNILASPEDCEECISDAYLALWNRIPPTRPGCFQAYLTGVLRNLSLMRLRSSRALRRGGGEIDLSFDELDECLKGNGSPQKALENEELREAIDRFLGMLSTADRVMFMARYWLYYPVSDIAEKTGFTESKVKSSLLRSRNKLRRFLTKEGLL